MQFYLPFFKQSPNDVFKNVVAWKVIDPDKSIKTGDILLFSGSSFVSSCIKLFTSSRWNHIGMACWVELVYKDGTTKDDLFSFELGSQAYIDLMTLKPTCLGIRLVRLADITPMYDLIAVRRLNRQNKYGKVGSNLDWPKRFQDFALKWKQTPYFGFKSLVKSYLFRPESPIGQSTCSHIAAIMLDEMGVYNLDFDASQIYPDSFCQASMAFPKDIFDGSEEIIWRDSNKINSRLIFLICVFILLIIVIFVIYVRSAKRNRR